MPLVLAAALPAFAGPASEERLARLCGNWERRLAPRLSPGQIAHCRRFSKGGDVTRARASRLLARLLALTALPPDCLLALDALDRPRVTGEPGWQLAFSHSGRAAFCLVLTPWEGARRSPGSCALDAEAIGLLLPTDRAFAGSSHSGSAGLRRWTLAEAMYKALGALPQRWEAVAAAAEQGAPHRSGSWHAGDALLSWRFAAAPGHGLCVALPGKAPFSLTLRWLAWQSLA